MNDKKQTAENRKANIKAAQNMLEYIATRSGEDRASVFLDIVIQLIFSGDVHTFRNADNPNVVRQQQVLNEIAALYKIEAPLLKNKEGYYDPNEIPF